MIQNRTLPTEQGWQESSLRGVRPATRDDAPMLIDILVEAFDRDPLSAWLFPDPVVREARHRDMFGAIFLEKFDQIFIDVTTDLSGAAIWYPPTGSLVSNLSPPPGSSPDVEQFFDAVRLASPAEPFWYLAFIGARTSKGGIGSALMKSGMARTSGLTALWTGNEANIRFYERHEFAVSAHCTVEGAQAWWMTR